MFLSKFSSLDSIVRSCWRRLKGAVSVPNDNPNLVVAQLQTFSKQIPVLYSIVAINTIALASVHYKFAPIWQSVIVPALLVGISISRTVSYWRAGQRTITPEYARRQLQLTIVLAGVLGGIFSFWALSLFPLGSASTQGHVAFFTGVTCLGIMVCLMHLRAAAITLGIAVVAPTAAIFLLQNSSVYVAVTGNLILVVIAVTYVLSNYSKRFEELVASQNALKIKAREAEELSEANTRLANLDHLTGLPNRRGFMAELEKQLTKSADTNHGFFLGVMDLDGFKSINDVHGHLAGDRLLVEVGKLLVGFHPNIFVGRLAGDEFGLIIRGSFSDVEITELGNTICKEIAKSHDFVDFTTSVGCSIGLVKFPDQLDSTDTLFEHADYALYAAKNSLRGRAVLFADSHRAEIREKSRIARELHEADLENELETHFQFIWDSQAGVVRGAESLARWSNKKLGNIPPSSFIKAAEQARFVNRLSKILLRKTLAEVSKWPNELFVSFNLSAHDIASVSNAKKIRQILQDSKFPPERVVFEITETALLQDLGQAKQSLEMLRSIGSKIALDDFGVGYSSLGYVQSLPIDKLKVDRSFITEIDNCLRSQAIVKTIADLCTNLGLECIVEGVETKSQLKVLQALGCRHIQGFYFCEPLEPKQALSFARSHAADDEAKSFRLV